MKQIPLGIAGLALLAGGLLATSSSARAQDEPQPVTSRALAASVDYGNDAVFQPDKHGVDFDQLGLRPQQAINLTVQFPVEMAGQTILVEPLDGGTATLPEEGLIVSSEGTVSFQFQASEDPGACRIAVHQPDDSNFIHLWVVDPQHPETTPEHLPGVY